MDQYTIKPIETFAEIDQCLDLQRSTWGMADDDLTPPRLFVLARTGGLPVLGAFDREGRVVAFLHTLLAFYGGVTAYYSHMLAVSSDLRDSGIGTRLKLAQRDHALAAGVPLVVWTFDPLQSRNAHLNINKLGVVVRRYAVNYYGEENLGVFDAGIGTDRVFAEWWVGSPRVARALEGVRSPEPLAEPVVEIPADLDAVRRQGDPMAWRLRTREAFQQCLAEGLVAVGLDHDRDAGTSRYRFATEEAVHDALHEA